MRGLVDRGSEEAQLEHQRPARAEIGVGVERRTKQERPRRVLRAE
jgi:hypothetical protein